MSKQLSYTIQYWWRISTLLFLCFTLSHCGFSLRGQYPVPPELTEIYVDSQDDYAQIKQIIQQNLLSSQVQLLKTPQFEYPILRLLPDRLDRRILTVFPNAQVAEYELIYTIDFELILGENLRASTITIYRDYQDDPDQALAKTRELELILTEVRQQAAGQILRQLAELMKDLN